MGTSEATRLARQVVADLAGSDDATERMGAVLLLMANEIDRLAEEGGRLSRRACSPH
jgi:hypothetical protein